MEEIIKKLDAAEVKTLLELMRMSKGEGSSRLQSVKVDLPTMDLKLDVPAMYLSWSRRVKGALAGRSLEGYLTEEKVEPGRGTAEWTEWNAIHMSLYTWLLNLMITSIAATVDGIESVKDIWAKLRRTYAGVGNNFRVFQIKREIDAVVQGDRTVQEYARDLECIWANYDNFSPMTSCSDPACRSREIVAQERTMQFLKNLNPIFEQRSGVLLAQTRIPQLEETIAAIMQEESRFGLHTGASGLPGMGSALAVSNPGNTGAQGETRRCHNCGAVGHLRQSCPKPPKKRETGGRGQFGGHSRGRGGQRGGYRANLMVAEDKGETGVVFTDEDHEFLEMLKRKQKAASDAVTEDVSTSLSSRGNTATYAHSAKDMAGEFSSYTHLAAPESIQTADDTAQPVVGDLSREEDWPETWDWHVA